MSRRRQRQVRLRRRCGRRTDVHRPEAERHTDPRCATCSRMRRWASGTGAGRAALAWDSRPSTDRDLSLSFRQSLWHLILGRHGRAAPRETLAGLAANEDGGRCGWIAGARDRSAGQHPRGVQPDIRRQRLEGRRQDRQGHRRGIAAQGLGRPDLPRIQTGTIRASSTTVRSGGRLSISSPTTPNCKWLSEAMFKATWLGGTAIAET